ncbi:MAG: hypothetical protein E7Z69_04980 [Thermoplasmata archaeon]|nr:hypothetical protein [Thermoplasmata archaeon]
MYFPAFFPTISSTSSSVKVPLHSVSPLARISSFSSRSEVCSNLKTMVEYGSVSSILRFLAFSSGGM